MTAEGHVVQSLLKVAQQQISEALSLDQQVARLEARLLLQNLLSVSHAWLLAHESDMVDASIYHQFQQQLQRRLIGEPIAHILGHREFFGLDLKVTADTLIPRPDTEILVEVALHCIAESEPYKVLDLGTGTGAIALAIASQRPYAVITAVDASIKALEVAHENAKRLGIQHVSFVQSDWFSKLGEQRFDLIISNPPYIAESDFHLKQGDLRFEPLSALASGEDGLNDIRQIVNQAAGHLNQQGSLHLEHGYDQAAQVAALMQSAGFSRISHTKDLAGITRVTSGYLN
jgi:release factor glutamine methyltransferase